MATLNKNNIAYLYGSAAPQIRPEVEPQRRPYVEPKSPRQEEYERKRRARERRQLMREKRRSALSVFAMSIATIMIFGMCATYIQLQTELNSRMSKVAELESSLIALRTDNDIMEKRIETSIDLDEIKQRAINELGMNYPTSEQVVYYNVDRTDYMEQYEEVPEESGESFFDLIFNN